MRYLVSPLTAWAEILHGAMSEAFLSARLQSPLEKAASQAMERLHERLSESAAGMKVPMTHRLTKLEVKLLEILQFNVREMEPEVLRERYLLEAIERKKQREKEQKP